MLNLCREPFSNSPDPGLFFPACRHRHCLQEIELSLRLRRGLNVILGKVGTGKTTLCRQLIRQLGTDPDMETHLISYPDFTTGADFLKTVEQMVATGPPDPSQRDEEVKEKIKQALFHKGVEENKTVILVIDEGQNLPGFCLEILREFLNYETNTFKLMQIVIFAQKEMEKRLRERSNFADRIALYYTLEALNFRETRSMIHHRLRAAGRSHEDSPLFSFIALWAIYHASRGFPRRIMHMCHRSLLAMIVQKKSRIGWCLALSAIRRTFSLQSFYWKRRSIALSMVALIALTAAGPISAMRENGHQSKSEGPTRLQGHSEEARPSAKPVVAPASSKMETTETKPRYPTLLGQVTLGPRDTLWDMINKVYGEFYMHHLHSIMQANPHIRDPKRLDVGERLVLPAIPKRLSTQADKIWWVRVAEKGQLSEALQTLDTMSGPSFSLALIPYWTQQQGLRFAIGPKRYFTEARAADSLRNRLPPVLFETSQVVSASNRKIVFFTRLNAPEH